MTDPDRHNSAQLIEEEPDPLTTVDETLPDSPEDPKALARIREEITELKGVVGSFSLTNLKDGSWFNSFVSSMLRPYAEKVIAKGGEAYYREQYPGVPIEQLVDRLTKDAIRYSALAGAASGGTASAAFAATIGTAGGSGVVAVPAGLTAITAETFYTTRLQLRLVYDIATLYRVPIDHENLDDLYKIFCIAFGIKGGSVVGGAAKQFGPEVARAQMRGLIHGHTGAIQQVAMRMIGPKLGRKITQRAILRTAVPVAAVGISGGWNYLATRAVAAAARHRLRQRSRLRQSASRLADHFRDSPDLEMPVLLALYALGRADDETHPLEEEVFRVFVEVMEPSQEVLEKLEQYLDIPWNDLLDQLARIENPALESALFESLELIVAVDGEIAKEELEKLEEISEALGATVDEHRLRKQAADFAPRDTMVDRIGATFLGAARGAKAASRSVGRQVQGLLRLKSRGKVAEEEPEPEEVQESAEEAALREALRKLGTLEGLREAGHVPEAEFQDRRRQILDAALGSNSPVPSQP